MTDLDQLCSEAMKRIQHYIERAAAQHLFMLRGKVRK